MSLLNSLVTVLKWTIILLVVYFLVGWGILGYYRAYCAATDTPVDQKKEGNIGNVGFLLYTLFLISPIIIALIECSKDSYDPTFISPIGYFFIYAVPISIFVLFIGVILYFKYLDLDEKKK